MDEALWEAEFRGFFWGEGHIGITYYKRKDKIFFRPIVRISLRADDEPLLREFQRHLGGTIHWRRRHAIFSVDNGKHYTTQPSMQWTLVNRTHLQNVVRILKASVLPAHKCADVSRFEEIITLLHGTGRGYSAEERERLHFLITAMRSARKYVPEQDGQVVSA